MWTIAVRLKNRQLATLSPGQRFESKQDAIHEANRRHDLKPFIEYVVVEAA